MAEAGLHFAEPLGGGVDAEVGGVQLLGKGGDFFHTDAIDPLAATGVVVVGEIVELYAMRVFVEHLLGWKLDDGEDGHLHDDFVVCARLGHQQDVARAEAVGDAGAQLDVFVASEEGLDEAFVE